jgi:hypothetical protein
MPTDSDVIFCKISSNISEACYFYQKTGASSAVAKTKCKSLGGDLVSWNSDEEQLTVSAAAVLCHLAGSASRAFLKPPVTHTPCRLAGLATQLQLVLPGAPNMLQPA